MQDEIITVELWIVSNEDFYGKEIVKMCLDLKGLCESEGLWKSFKKNTVLDQREEDEDDDQSTISLCLACVCL